MMSGCNFQLVCFYIHATTWNGPLMDVVEKIAARQRVAESLGCPPSQVIQSITTPKGCMEDPMCKTNEPRSLISEITTQRRVNKDQLRMLGICSTRISLKTVTGEGG